MEKGENHSPKKHDSKVFESVREFDIARHWIKSRKGEGPLIITINGNLENLSESDYIGFLSEPKVKNVSLIFDNDRCPKSEEHPYIIVFGYIKKGETRVHVVNWLDSLPPTESNTSNIDQDFNPDTTKKTSIFNFIKDFFSNFFANVFSNLIKP